MLSQMDPSLVTFCDKIAEEGGPISLPVEDGTTLPQPPVVQMMSVTRVSARLRNVQPEVNLDQSYEATRKPKKQTDASQTGNFNNNLLQYKECMIIKLIIWNLVCTSLLVAEESPDIEMVPSKPSEDAVEDCTEQPTVEIPVPDEGDQPGNSTCDAADSTPQDADMSDGETSNQVDSIKLLLVDRSKDYSIPQLERLYTSILKGVFETKNRCEVKDLKPSILRFLFEFAEDPSRF